ncbi:MAG: ABC transporter substrate-binding protein [Erysipelotrichia bacterium]|nr:ABC transporter substrate-binding protein [Erysipelotrichia bacterium]
MKKLLPMILSAAMLSSLAGCSSGTAASSASVSASNPRIGLIQLMEHTSLNEIRDSFLDQLTALGYEDGVNCTIDYQNAQGDMNNLTTIVQTMEGSKDDIVVAITTPAAQAAVDLAQKGTPLIFSAVTDPVAAGLVTSLTDTSANITGTSDAVAINKIMDLALEIYPDIKTFGYLYNPGEDNSVANLALVQAYCKEKGLSLETQGITSGNELQTASSALCSKVDAIVLGNDNTVAESMPVLANIANAAKIPVFPGADSMVKDGGFATVGIDYTDLGKENANIVDKVLKGTAVSDIPVKVFNTDLYIYVNKASMDALGAELPDSIKNDSKLVIVGD